MVSSMFSLSSSRAKSTRQSPKMGAPFLRSGGAVSIKRSGLARKFSSRANAAFASSSFQPMKFSRFKLFTNPKRKRRARHNLLSYCA